MDDFIAWAKAFAVWANANGGLAGWVFGIFAVFATIVSGIWAFRNAIGRGLRRVLHGAIGCFRFFWGKGRNLYHTIGSGVWRVKVKVRFYLWKRGVMDMKLNFNGVPNLKRVWEDEHLDSDLKRASFLSASLVKWLNEGGDVNQRNARIQHLTVATPALKELLVSNTFDLDLFCALVSAFVVRSTAIYREDLFKTFPVPFSEVKTVVSDLFGGEEGLDLFDEIIDELDRELERGQ